jgi:hypothetical protein
MLHFSQIKMGYASLAAISNSCWLVMCRNLAK